MLQSLGIFIFLQNQTIFMIYVWFILYGIGMGVGMTVNPLIMARYFGRKAYGSIRGSTTMFMTPVAIIAPIYAGWVYDTTGSYMSAFILLSSLLAVSGIVGCFVYPPKPPAEITHVKNIL